VHGSQHRDILEARGGGREGPATTVGAGLGGAGAKRLRPFSPRPAARWPRADGLLAAGGTPVALARPGISWRPVCPVREAHMTVLVVHAHPLTAGPGRKPAVRDGAGLGARRRHGLRTASCRPPRGNARPRRLTASRPGQATCPHPSASASTHASATRPQERRRGPARPRQCTAHVTSVPRRCCPKPAHCSTPSQGGARVADTVGAAIGTDMTSCPRHGHLASWAGMCPGNPSSAGTHRSGHTRTGHVDGRGALPQAAWAATRTKPTALAAPFRRRPPPLGPRRALGAGGQRLRAMAWPRRSTHAADQDLGRADVDRRAVQAYRLQRLRTLAALGLNVAVEPATTVAEASSSCS
jgi:hypothetical protein